MTTAPEKRRERAGALALATIVGVIAFLPFARGMLRGESFYFRDLSRQFFPFRSFVVEGLRNGELRYWNPLVHEGEPLPFPPISYPLELLQVLVPDEWGLSLVLAIHVPPLVTTATPCIFARLASSTHSSTRVPP